MGAPKLEPSVADWRVALRDECSIRQANRIAAAAVAAMKARQIKECEARIRIATAELRNTNDLRALQGRIGEMCRERKGLLENAYGPVEEWQP